MERSFGRSFGDVEVHTGMAAELEPLGAQALTVGNKVVFADTTPSPALVAHEATHVAQNEQAGTAVAMASGVVAPRDSAAEAEADTNANLVAAHAPGVRLPPTAAAPAAHVHLAPKRLVPDADAPPPRTTILVPDADHPSKRGIDGEQVIQTGKTVDPGKATPLRGKSWKSLAEVTESVHVQDDSGDTLHIDITYRLESRPAELSDVPDIWIHTERRALLTIGSGEHAGATIVGQARIRLAPEDARDPKAALAMASIGADHRAQIYLAEAGQYVNLHGAGGRTSLLADAAGNDVLAYDDPLRTLVGLKNLLKQQHVAGHGGDVAKMHAQAQRLLAAAKHGSIVLEREIASVASYHDPHPGKIAPVRFLVGNIANWLAANQQAGRDDTEDARQLRNARDELERLLNDADNARSPKRSQIADAADAPVRFLERTFEGVGEVGAMAVDAVVLGVDAIGEAMGIGSFEYHPISKYGKAIEASGANTTTALVTMVNGFADEWSDAIERANHGDYRSMTDVSIDTLMMIDGARTGGVIAIEKGEALAAKLGSVAKSARALASGLPAGAAEIAAVARGLPAEARDIAAAMADGADAFVARLRAGGMQMATEGGGGGPGPNHGGLSAETLAEAAQAAKDAFKGKRLAQEAAKHEPTDPAPHSPGSSAPPVRAETTGGSNIQADSTGQIEAALGRKIKPEDVKALTAALGDEGMAALARGAGDRLPELVAEAGSAAIIACVKKFGAPAASRLLERLGGNGLSKLLNDAEAVALQLDAQGNHGSYRWGGTGKTERALAGSTARVYKSSNPASGVRTLDIETPAGPLKLEERGRYADVRIDPSKMSSEDLQLLDKLFADYGIADVRAKQSILEALENARLVNSAPDLASSIKKVRPVLEEAKASALKATNGGTPTAVQDVILANGKTPLALQAEGPAVIEANALIADGILEDRAFQSARTPDEGRDAVSQRLQASVTKDRAEGTFGKKGGKVFTKIEFKGDLFVDETSAKFFEGSRGKPLVATDVAPDLDAAYVVDNNGKLNIEYVAGVKIVKNSTATGASADAANQNRLGKAAVEAGSKRFPTVTRRGDHVWAEVKSVSGNDPTGIKLDLTGKLVWDPAAKTETIGPKGAPGFDANLPVSKKELDNIVVAIWRLAELRRR